MKEVTEIKIMIKSYVEVDLDIFVFVLANSFGVFIWGNSEIC